MSAAAPAPGGRAVGLLDDLALPERLAILGLRRWCDRGPAALSGLVGAAAQAGLCRLCTLCATASRRPLLHHGADCPCLGADESALATLIALAATGEREDALMLALTIVRADHAPALVAAAADCGLALRRHLLRAAEATLH